MAFAGCRMWIKRYPRACCGAFPPISLSGMAPSSVGSYVSWQSGSQKVAIIVAAIIGDAQRGVRLRSANGDGGSTSSLASLIVLSIFVILGLLEGAQAFSPVFIFQAQPQSFS